MGDKRGLREPLLLYKRQEDGKMKNIQVVIGSNFGDEGKGLFTDYLASKLTNSIVVMNNGGSQRAHRVVCGDKEHVFNHFGSGVFAGREAYASEFYSVNPITYCREMEELQEIGVEAKLVVNEECRIVTPFDIIVSQMIEDKRGKGRHGSCGVGINETVVRNLTEEYRLKVKDAKDIEKFKGLLVRIRDNYFWNRLNELEIEVQEEDKEWMNSEGLIDNFCEVTLEFMREVKVAGYDYLRSFDNVIIENGQGLLLDQNSSYFPHVTRSNTGLKNVVEIIDKIGDNKVEVGVNYITRAYATRHGAGEFRTEVIDRLLYPNVYDKCNLYGKYQGGFRFGYLDVGEMAESINNDFSLIKDKYKATKILVVTCMDQMEDVIDYMDGEMKQENKSEYAEMLKRRVEADKLFVSYGESREYVKEIEE